MLVPQFLFGCVLAFEAGIFFASFFSSSLFFALFFLLAGVSFMGLFWQRWRMVSTGAFFLAGAFGIFLYGVSSSLPPEITDPIDISFEGTVKNVQKEERGLQVLVEPKDPLKGNVLLFVSRFEDVSQGDRILVSGELESPKVFDDFNYPLYLAKDDVFFLMFSPELEVQERRESLPSRLREMLQERIDASLPLPESSLLASMLLGNKAGLSEDLKGKLNATGTRHITAISGMHVAILSGMLFVFLLNVGMSKKKSSLLVLLFLVFFVAFTGAQASAVRAGIMGGAFLVSGLAGRRNAGLRTLVFAAALMLLFNPLLLGYDAGFQLSFLAVLGILLFLPFLQYFFRKASNYLGIRDVALMSIAAQLFTLPLVLHHFGTLSFVSLATNLLIVPLLPLVLFSGVLFLALSTIFPIVANLLAFPVGLLLSYVSFVVSSFSEFPFAAHNVEAFPLWVLLPFLIAAGWFAMRFQKQRRFQFTEETML